MKKKEAAPKKKRVKAIPDGYHTATPGLCVRGAAEAIEFYKKAFGAVEEARFPGPGGHGIMHAQIRIGDSPITLADEFPNMGGKAPSTVGGATGGIMLYVQDVDAAFQQAVGAGAKVDTPPTDMFWGDRFARVTDPFGHAWALATHIEDVTPEEMGRRGQEFLARMTQGQA
jgi:PhnB protein